MTCMRFRNLRRSAGLETPSSCKNARISDTLIGSGPPKPPDLAAESVWNASRYQMS